MIITQLAVLKMNKWCDVNTGCESFIFWNLTIVVVFGNIRMDKDNSMTVDWDEFLHHIILNPVDNIGELVSSWKHSLVWSFPLCFTFTAIKMSSQKVLSPPVCTPAGVWCRGEPWDPHWVPRRSVWLQCLEDICYVSRTGGCCVPDHDGTHRPP